MVGTMLQSRLNSTRNNLNLVTCTQLRDPLECLYLTVMKVHSRKMVWTLYQAILLLTLLTVLVHPCSAHIWEKQGCHLVSRFREEKIDRCVMFNITINVCRGFCESYAVPSPSRTLDMNTDHVITSRAECCSMRETKDLRVRVKCFDDDGYEEYRTFTYKSAESCFCSICKNGIRRH